MGNRVADYTPVIGCQAASSTYSIPSRRKERYGRPLNPCRNSFERFEERDWARHVAWGGGQKRERGES